MPSPPPRFPPLNPHCPITGPPTHSGYILNLLEIAEIPTLS